MLASGQGTNLEAILKAVDSGEIAGRVEMVISDRQAARALEIARRRRIKALFLNPVDYRDRNTYDAAVVEQLNSAAIDLVVLAGFMRLLSADFVRQFPLRIMNIHPSLLPAFPGGNGVEQALAYGVKVTGCTVHFVD